MPPTPKIEKYELFEKYINENFEKSSKTYHVSQFGASGVSKSNSACP